MATRNENGRAPEGVTAVSITREGAILGATLKDMPSVAARQVAGFRRMLAEMFPTEETVTRYREATDEHEIDPDLGMCRRACGRIAQYNGECWNCASGRAA